MRVYVWIAIPVDGPTIVVACRDQRNLHEAIRERVALECGFDPGPRCCVAHEHDAIEEYLLAHGYDQCVMTATEVADA